MAGQEIDRATNYINIARSHEIILVYLASFAIDRPGKTPDSISLHFT